MARLRYKKIYSHLYFFLLFLFGTASAHAQNLAIKTDVVKLGMMMPNIGAEMAIGNKFSLDVSIQTAFKPWGQDMKCYGILPEFRYWISGRQMARAYVGVSAMYAHYDMYWDKFMHKGDAAGAGITVGYTWYLGLRWRVEAYTGFGIVGFTENRFAKEDAEEDLGIFKQNNGNNSGYKILPAKLGASISYILR